MTAKKWTRIACRINLLIGYKTEAIATDHWARMRFEPPARPRRPIWQLGGTRKGSLIDNSDTSKQSIKCYLFLTTIRWNVYNNLTNTNTTTMLQSVKCYLPLSHRRHDCHSISLQFTIQRIDMRQDLFFHLIEHSWLSYLSKIFCLGQPI